MPEIREVTKGGNLRTTDSTKRTGHFFMKRYFLKTSSMVKGCRIKANFAVPIDIVGTSVPAASFHTLHSLAIQG